MGDGIYQSLSQSFVFLGEIITRVDPLVVLSGCQHCTMALQLYFPTMQCLGCKGRFKNEGGLIRHLSKKPLCQNAMGIVVPPITSLKLVMMQN
jgi:hypothetical protein